MRYVLAVTRSKLLSPILLSALLPLSFRASSERAEFVFLGGSNAMIAFALWGLCAALVGLVLVRSSRSPLLDRA